MTSYLKIWGPFGKTVEHLKRTNEPYRIEWGFIALRAEDYRVVHLTLAYRCREDDFTIAVFDGRTLPRVGRAGETTDALAWVGEVSNVPIKGLIIPVLTDMLADEDKAAFLAAAIRKARQE